MALEISGYNAQFKQFVDFVTAAEAAGKQKAVARDEEAPAMGLPASGFISV